LWVIDPAIVTVERDRRTFAKTFVIRSSGTTDRHPTDPALRLTAADVLHVRGPTLKGGDVGVTPLRLAADALGSAIARNKYEGRAYRNDAVPAAIIEDPAAPNRQKARDTAAVWYQTHGDTNNAGRVGVLMGGATLNRLGLSMQDAQFVESHEFSVSEVARMFRIPASILGAGDLAVVEQDTKRFLSFGLGGRLGGSRPQSGPTRNCSAAPTCTRSITPATLFALTPPPRRKCATRTSSPACCSSMRPVRNRAARRSRTGPARSRRSPRSAVPLTRPSTARATTATATERAAND
jgi:hypothetical protein